uniref:DUF2919 family protein n=1 Tax=Thaumasiovibrio occultus TaxID=1891184 RepID=UPI000B35CABE|nr:DUF2919 family protein [Thaumasiovibrio occultus]
MIARLGVSEDAALAIRKQETGKPVNKGWILYLDKHGEFRIPVLLWLGWALLSRSWCLFVLAGVSRDKGPELLGLFYPYIDELHWQLAISFPILLLMWLAGSRHNLPAWCRDHWWLAKYLTMLVLLIDMSQIIAQMILAPLTVTLPLLSVLVLLLWFGLYLWRSQQVKWAFEFQPEAYGELENTTIKK